jgi:hypothetical protein
VDLPEIPSFDELAGRLFVLIGLPSIIVWLLGTAFAIASYVGPVKILARGAIGTGRLVVQYRPVAGVVSVFAALAVPVAHLATLVMVYLAANYLTVVFDSQRGGELGLVFDAFPQIESLRMLLDANWYIAAWSAVEPFLELNWFTGGYTLLAIILLTISYFIREDSEVRTLGYILAWPGIIWCAVVVLLLLFFCFVIVDYLSKLLFNPNTPFYGGLGEFLKGAFFILESGVEWLIYIGACRAAVGAPRLIFRLWKKPQVDSEAVNEAS